MKFFCQWRSSTAHLRLSVSPGVRFLADAHAVDQGDEQTRYEPNTKITISNIPNDGKGLLAGAMVEPNANEKDERQVCQYHQATNSLCVRTEGLGGHCLDCQSAFIVFLDFMVLATHPRPVGPSALQALPTGAVFGR